MPSAPRYWFPAKRFGWGWGLPVCWQGWLVMLVFLAMVSGAIHYLSLTGNRLAFYGLIALSVLALLAVCRWKGEPTRWRWGGD